MKKILLLMIMTMFVSSVMASQDGGLMPPIIEPVPVDEEAPLTIDIGNEQKIEHIKNRVMASMAGVSFMVKPSNFNVEITNLEIDKRYVIRGTYNVGAYELAAVKPYIVDTIINGEGPVAISKYHAELRAMVKGDPAWGEKEHLFLHANEIRMLSHHGDWKVMRSHLASLDRYYSDKYPIWTEMRVESWLIQAEVMLFLRPESEEKHRAIGGLLAKVRLAQKSNDMLENDFTITDRVITLEEGELPEPTKIAMGIITETREINADDNINLSKKGQSKDGSFERFVEKLKFWQ